MVPRKHYHEKFAIFRLFFIGLLGAVLTYLVGFSQSWEYGIVGTLLLVCIISFSGILDAASHTLQLTDTEIIERSWFTKERRLPITQISCIERQVQGNGYGYHSASIRTGPLFVNGLYESFPNGTFYDKIVRELRAAHPEIPVAEDYDEGLFYHAQKKREKDIEEVRTMEESWSPTKRRIIQSAIIILGIAALVCIKVFWR